MTTGKKKYHLHICNPYTEKVGFKCKICESNLHAVYSGYGGYDCLTCGYTTETEFFGELILRMRNHAKITRKQLAGDIGVSPHTLKAYEFKYIPKHRIEQLKDYFKMRYA